jgi:hypothetical protein
MPIELKDFKISGLEIQMEVLLLTHILRLACTLTQSTAL